MSISCKFERSTLSYGERGVILRSHHPELYETGLDDLKALRRRDMRDKENTALAKRREARGKGRREDKAFPAQPSIPCSASRYSPPP
jgi:hypothetical protein